LPHQSVTGICYRLLQYCIFVVFCSCLTLMTHSDFRGRLTFVAQLAATTKICPQPRRNAAATERATNVKNTEHVTSWKSKQTTIDQSALGVSATCCTDRAGCCSDLGCTTCCTTQQQPATDMQQKSHSKLGQLPIIKYDFNKRNFIVQSLFNYV